MTNVVQLVPRIDDRPAPSDPELLLQTINLVVSLTKHITVQDRRIADLESRVPPPRFDPHEGRLTPKQAAFASGFSLATIHRWFRSGAIKGKREGVRIFIDPATLPMRK
jgi:hypothetical protein